MRDMNRGCWNICKILTNGKDNALSVTFGFNIYDVTNDPIKVLGTTPGNSK